MYICWTFLRDRDKEINLFAPTGTFKQGFLFGYHNLSKWVYNEHIIALNTKSPFYDPFWLGFFCGAHIAKHHHSDTMTDDLLEAHTFALNDTYHEEYFRFIGKEIRQIDYLFYFLRNKFYTLKPQTNCEELDPIDMGSGSQIVDFSNARIQARILSSKSIRVQFNGVLRDGVSLGFKEYDYYFEGGPNTKVLENNASCLMSLAGTQKKYFVTYLFKDKGLFDENNTLLVSWYTVNASFGI